MKGDGWMDGWMNEHISNRILIHKLHSHFFKKFKKSYFF